jgi:hypothetical protein
VVGATLHFFAKKIADVGRKAAVVATPWQIYHIGGVLRYGILKYTNRNQ